MLRGSIVPVYSTNIYPRNASIHPIFTLKYIDYGNVDSSQIQFRSNKFLANKNNIARKIAGFFIVGMSRSEREKRATSLRLGFLKTFTK